MNRTIFLSTLFFLSIPLLSFADNSDQVITLKDGSQIVGQLVGINNGVYTIKAPIIGNITANVSDVVSINNRSGQGNSGSNYPTNPVNPGSGSPQPVGPQPEPGQGNPSQPHPIGPEPEPGQGNPTWPSQPPDLDQQIAREQRELMSNPQSMALLMQMTQDPDIMKLLQDPELVEAVEHHDLQAVENSPRIKELMNNPHIQEFLKRLEELMHHDHDHDHDHDPYTAAPSAQ